MEIPISNVLLLCLIFLLIGAVIMMLLQYLLFIKLSNLPEESEEQKQINAKYTLPVNIKQIARSLNTTESEDNNYNIHQNNVQDSPTLISLNFVMQFLFHELKNSNRVRKWFYRKLSIELDELITKTTTGKLLDKLTIKELELGDQFPDIRSLTVHNVQLDDSEQRIESLDLLLDINYIGNFSTSIDADMVLGKKGSIMLKVKQLSGTARLQFTRKPYTHWSLSFLGDPELSLAIESKYQGRQMQSNITNLISNQIRKAVRRKHTLPNYKLRYKPFFHWNADDEMSECDIQPNGGLIVRVAELSRLMAWPGIVNIYCTITLAPVPFIEAQQKDNRHVLISLDIIIHKAKNQQIGIVFKQNSSQVVKIESVLPNTPACKSNLLSGDVLVAIEGKQVTTIQQIAKVVKNLQSTICRLRIQRIIPGIIRNDAILEDLENYDDLCDVPETLKPDTDGDESLKHTTAKASHNRNSNGFSQSNTPVNSPKKSNLINKTIKKTISRESSEYNKDKDKDKSKLDEMFISSHAKQPTITENQFDEANYFYQHSTIDCTFSPLIHMDDMSNFQLDAKSRFLNVCVFGKSAGESVMLGYSNIPITQILIECSETSLNQCLKQIVLNPATLLPIKSHSLTNQSGFNANLCFGDILFGFSWNGNPNSVAIESRTKDTSKSQSPVRSQSAVNDKVKEEFSAETVSLKSANSSVDFNVSSAAASVAVTFKAHNFIRTHFHRATQCDFCGKKIWLKDAMQCKDCTMCCHKKCITKCQNATVCGPMDYYASTPTTISPSTVVVNKPEFTITQPEYIDLLDPKCSLLPENAPSHGSAEQTQPVNLDVSRAGLTEMLAQGIKRQASNLDIPGMVSSLSGNSSQMNSKSLPPSPQHTYSRNASITSDHHHPNPFEKVKQHLEALPLDCTAINFEQVNLITEPIVQHSQNDDLMNLAKRYSKHLYVEVPPNVRVAKINELLTKTKVALDMETEGFTVPKDTENKLESDSSSMVNKENKSEERVQALSIIMLYLCTGLQHAQGIVMQ